jgi:hypothetical protein
MTTPPVFRNRFLFALAEDDAAVIVPPLLPVDLPLRRRLRDAHRPITQVFFLEDGISPTGW